MPCPLLGRGHGAALVCPEDGGLAVVEVGWVAGMTAMDPLVPALAGLIVDVVWFLDSCGDDEVDPDSAVKML